MIKRNYKLIVGIIIGLLIAGTTVYAATIISSINVGYSNENSKLVADNVQDAIDEVYKKASESKAPQPKNENIKAMYYYDENKESKDFCVTGDEKTCKVNTCYLNNTEGSCSPGTIVEYMVNEKEKIRFHVIKDNGSTLTLQSQKNTVSQKAWYEAANDNTKGPLTILESLEDATSNWSNVNEFNYSIGTKDSTLGYSGCHIPSCATKSYSLEKENIKARMITFQEAISFGCYDACPVWMINYLTTSTSYGGTKNADNYVDFDYWTMSAAAWGTDMSFRIMHNIINSYYIENIGGARAVVEITKS